MHPLDLVPPSWSRIVWAAQGGPHLAASLEQRGHSAPGRGGAQSAASGKPAGEVRPGETNILSGVPWRPGRKWDQLIHICLSRLEYKWGDGRINLFKNVIS